MGKFWRINGSKVFGEEKFGESVGSLLKTLVFINIGGENFGELPTVCQNFPTYGIAIDLQLMWNNVHFVCDKVKSMLCCDYSYCCLNTFVTKP